MVKSILKIQLKQLNRLATEVGLFRLIFLLGLAAYLFFAVYVKLQDPSYKDLIVGLFAFIIFGIHTKRKDKIFLNLYSPQPQIIFFIEYLLLSLPILVLLVYYQFWLHTFFMIAFIFVLPFLKTPLKKYSINTWLQKQIPNDNFEWKAGIRKQFILFMSVWLIAFFTSFFIGSVIIALFILGIVVMSFYEKNESLPMLLAKEESPKTFLKRKIWSHLLTYLSVMIPLFFSFIIFHPAHFYIPLLEIIIFSILIVYNILLKYAFYLPNEKAGGTQIFSAIGSISVLVPFVLIIVLVLGIKFWFQAHRNLKFHLHDFH